MKAPGRRFRALVLALACVASIGPARALAPPVARERLVGFRIGTPPAEQARVLAAARAVPLHRLPELDAVRALVADERALAAHPSVEYVEPVVRGVVASPPAAPNDPLWGAIEQWRLRRSNALLGWQRWPGRYYAASTRPRTAVKVAVLDTRIDTTHADFINARGTSTDARSGGQVALADARTFVDPEQLTGNMDWHGTFIAGLIGAAANNGRDITGAAYAARIVPIIVANGSGVATADAVAQGIVHAVAVGAEVINISLAIPAADSTLLRAVDRAGAAGRLIVAAAGNHSGTAKMYPAAYAAGRAHVMAVSATTALDTIALPCSNYNSYVTIAAPATNIVSLRAGGGTFTQPCGTSAATALVSSAAAMVSARFPTLSAAAVRARLTSTADDVEARGRDQFTGYGRLNVQRALWSGAGAITTAARPAAAGSRERTTLTATASGRGVSAMEYFIDRPVSPGRGTKMIPTDRAWGEAREAGTATVPTSRLSEGIHELYVRARDASGTWGPAAVTVLVVDRQAPDITGENVDPPFVIPGQPGTRVEFALTDALSRTLSLTISMIDVNGVAKATWRYRVPPATYSAEWRGTTDPPGGTRFSGRALPPGPYTVRFTVVDEAGRSRVKEVACTVAPDTR